MYGWATPIYCPRKTETDISITIALQSFTRTTNRHNRIPGKAEHTVRRLLRPYGVARKKRVKICIDGRQVDRKISKNTKQLRRGRTIEQLKKTNHTFYPKNTSSTVETSIEAKVPSFPNIGSHLVLRSALCGRRITYAVNIRQAHIKKNKLPTSGVIAILAVLRRRSTG